MYLTKEKKVDNRTVSQVNFEKVVDDLLMITINNDVNTPSNAPSYWRLTAPNGNPPLEIGINTETGSIQNITVFVDMSCFKNLILESDKSVGGNIVFNTRIFQKTNDYVDITDRYAVSMIGNKFVCVFGDKYNNINETFRNGRIEFFVNKENELCGFAVIELNKKEIEQIKSL